MGDIAAPEERAELVGWLTELDEHLRFIAAKWAEKARIQSQYLQPLPRKPRWGFGIGVAVFAGVFLVLAIVDASYPTLIEMLFVAFGIPTLAAVAVVMLRNRTRLAVLNARIDEANAERAHYNDGVLRPAEEAVDNELREAARELVDAGAYEIYPRAYMYEEAVQYVIGVIANHRANSLTEALNLYEEALHRARVENAQQQMVAEQRRQQALQVVGMLANAAGQASINKTIREEGESTRGTIAATAWGIKHRRS